MYVFPVKVRESLVHSISKRISNIEESIRNLCNPETYLKHRFNFDRSKGFKELDKFCDIDQFSIDVSRYSGTISIYTKIDIEDYDNWHKEFKETNQEICDFQKSIAEFNDLIKQLETNTLTDLQAETVEDLLGISLIVYRKKVKQ